MNYYYELHPARKKVFGQEWSYWCLANCSIADGGGRMPYGVHDEFMANSQRVWLENANGVYLVKPRWGIYRGQVDRREFTMIKLRARTIKWWQDE